ncbi:acyclic terpene utilization AtuA family protein [Nonomuraea sp. LPB2021202275-12-8]|uniref:acyclic terpene utilization AtuA family protein n=1 Tax=Nonomuraea sp. LPB2021202275-12-8 TaxID=3120159 RepID=UPI00300DBC7B
MLRIGTWGAAGSADLVACGWRDGQPGHLETGIKLIFEATGNVPEMPGLKVATRAVRGAPEIARALLCGLDVVLAAPDDPAAPVVAAGIWHYGWTVADSGALASATVAGLALAGLPAPGVLEIRRDGRAWLDGGVTVADVLARVTARHPPDEAAALLAAVRLTQERPSRIRVEPGA